mmetsp:Transcript_32614/g.85275  ORF Transcript_32614/g.85275 Transcript_32614/m.85275 type:complete len:239 (-) Transcript_32614:20-736(-)
MPWRRIVARGCHADLRARVPARRVAVAQLEAARVWSERVDDRRIAACARDDDQGDGLLQRLCKGTGLEHRRAVELERAVAVESGRLIDWHALVHARHVAVAAQVGAALHKPLLALLHEDHVRCLCLQPHDAGGPDRLPLAKLRDPGAPLAVAQQHALHSVHQLHQASVRRELRRRAQSMADAGHSGQLFGAEVEHNGFHDQAVQIEVGAAAQMDLHRPAAMDGPRPALTLTPSPTKRD